MTEKWIGHYSYDSDFLPENLKSRPVPFNMEWEVDDGLVTGICNDEESREFFAEPAGITGFIESDFISLIKKYPCFWYEDARGNIKVCENLPSQEIHYSGYRDGDQYHGVWEFSVMAEYEDGYILEQDIRGTWTLFRA